MSRTMRTPEAAECLGLAPRTLENWRQQGKGPRYARVGHVVIYREEDIDAYIRSCLIGSDTERVG